MCLLHTHPANATLTFEDIEDFYSHNSDGLGVMLSEDNKLVIKKCLPNNAQQAWTFYLEHIQGRDCVVHWRMKTHGQIDLANCHPYEIFGEGHAMPMAMMHNGILSQGNAKDTKFSDTWHYVNDTLVPLLDTNPDLFTNPAFIDVIEAHIGRGNRFVLMNHLGDVAIMNEHDFVDYAGCKLSNTYAWDSGKAGYGFSAKRYTASIWDNYYPRAGVGTGGVDEDYGDYWQGGRGLTTVAKGSVVDGNFRKIEDEAADKEATETTDEFFNALQFSELDEAFRELSYLDVKDFLYLNTSSVLWDAYDAVLEGTATEDELVDFVIGGTSRVMNKPLGFDAAVAVEDAAEDSAAEDAETARALVALHH